MSENSSKKLKILSFFFTIIIVAYHVDLRVFPFYHSRVLIDIILGFWEYMANVALSYFFMTTAFLLYLNADQINVKTKLRRRVHSLVIPFLLWNTIYLIVKCIKTGVLDGMLAVLDGFSFHPYDGPLWYVFAIILLSLLSPIVVRLKNRSWFRTGMVGFCILMAIVYSLHIVQIVGNSLGWPTEIIIWTKRLARYLPSYTAGAFVGLYFPEWIDRANKRKPGSRKSVAFLLFIVSSAISWSLWEIHVPDGIKLIILFVTPVLIWYLILPCRQGFVRWIHNTFLIYASHVMLLDWIVTPILNLSIWKGSMNKYGKDLLCLAVTVMCCVLVWMIAMIFTKVLEKMRLGIVVKVLCGGRN